MLHGDQTETLAQASYAGPFTAAVQTKRWGQGLGRAGQEAGPRNSSRVGRDTRPGSQPLLALTVVLDDALEVVGHQRPESPFVRQAQAVGKDDRSIHHCAMDKLEGGREQERTLFIFLLPQGWALLKINHIKAIFRSTLQLHAALLWSSGPTSPAGGSE